MRRAVCSILLVLAACARQTSDFDPPREPPPEDVAGADATAADAEDAGAPDGPGPDLPAAFDGAADAPPDLPDLGVEDRAPPPEDVPCGERGQPCCRGVACAPGLACTGGSCVPPPLCGGEGQPCCAGTACNAGYMCAAGMCVVACAGGQTVCAGAGCRDLGTDRLHCGACGNACAPGLVCAAGACTRMCAPDQTLCDTSCAALDRTPAHCGACGNACPAPPRTFPTCTGGRCGATCQPGFADCDGMPGNGCEASLDSTAHCGACGNVCVAPVGGGASCVARSCRATCPVLQTNCMGTCRSLTSDPAHCGACGRVCPAPMGGLACCSGGSCRGICPSGQTDCMGTCRSLNTDPAHCGACGRACVTPMGATTTCSLGSCRTTCPTGQTACASGCRDLRADPMACGSCLRVCAAGMACVAGTCTMRYVREDSPATVAFVDACVAPGRAVVLVNTVATTYARVPLPFAFRYYRAALPAGSSLSVTTSGYVAMEGTLSTASSGSIPSSLSPNAVVAPHWGPGRTRATGVCVATVGTAPDRRLVIEWADAYYTSTAEHLTYEVIFHEASGAIDFVYGTMTGVQPRTTGIENQDGSEGISVCAAGRPCPVATGARIRFAPVP